MSKLANHPSAVAGPLVERAGETSDMRRIELVLKGRYRKFRTLTYPKVPPITTDILNKWRDQMGLPRKEDGTNWEYAVSTHNAVRDKQQTTSQAAKTKEDSTSKESKEGKRAPASKKGKQAAFDYPEESDFATEEKAIKAGTVVRTEEVEGRVNDSVMSGLGGLGVPPEHDETYLPTDMIRSFASFFPDTHPYHLSDHCCVCGGSMLFATQCTTVGELHEPPMLLPNSPFTLAIDGKQVSEKAEAKEFKEGGETVAATRTRRDYVADCFVPTNTAVANSIEKKTISEEVEGWKRQDLEVKYSDNPFMIEEYLRSHNLLNPEAEEIKCRHDHKPLASDTEMAEKFIEGATHGWHKGGSATTAAGSCAIDSTTPYQIFSVDDSLLLNTIGEGCFCPTAMCFRKQENVDRLFKMGPEFPGGLEISGFHGPATSKQAGASSGSGTSSGPGTFRDTHADGLGSCPATRVPLATEEQIQHLLFDKDFGFDAVTNTAVLGPKFTEGEDAHVGLCDMWSGDVAELGDGDDGDEGEHVRRGVKAQEKSGAEDVREQPEPSAIGMAIANSFLPTAGGGGGVETATSIDELLASYEHASFFNHSSLDAPQPEETVELGRPTGVPTGWRRSDCELPASTEGPSPMLPHTREKEAKDAALHTRSIPETVDDSPSSTPTTKKEGAEEATRQLPTSFWHPDMRALRYRTDWAAVLDFMEQQIELRQKEAAAKPLQRHREREKREPTAEEWEQYTRAKERLGMVNSKYHEMD